MNMTVQSLTLETTAPLVLTRRFAARPERVYAAWTDAALLRQWFGPEGLTITRCEADARVGGRWRIEASLPDGRTVGVGGVFKRLEPPSRIVLSWLWDDRPPGAPDMEVDVALSSVGGGTEMVLQHSGFTGEEQRGCHDDGWTAGFRKLAALLEVRHG